MATAVGLVPEPAAAKPVNVTLSGGNGVVRATEPGLSCADDGKGAYRHYFVDAVLPGGVLANAAGKARATLDVHHDGDKALRAQAPNAFLLGTESHVTLSNQRGSVQVALPAGTCAQPALGFDGTTASLGSGTWGAISGTGAYRQVSGSGTYAFTAEMSPGADNPWTMALSGQVTVLQPALTARVHRTYWGNLGLDYATRVVTVVYRVANTGEGDAFGVVFTGAPSPTAGVRACGEPQSLTEACPVGSPPAQPLGDLPACADATLATCETELVSVRYRIEPLLGSPCTLAIVGCAFDADVNVVMHDALDERRDTAARVRVTAPILPPPL